MIANTLRSSFLIAAPLLLAVACGEAGTAKTPAAATQPATTAPAATTPATAAASTAVHGVKCGCAIPSIGECGNYIEVDGKYVALETPTPLGPMAFCGKDGLRAKVDGQVEGEVFVASSFALEP